MFAVTPLVQALPCGRGIETFLMTLVLLSALLAVSGRRWTIWGVALAIPAISGRVLNHFCPDVVPLPLFHVAALAFLGYVIGHLLRFILKAPRVDHEVLCGSIAMYLMMGLLWTMAYVMLNQFDPGALAFAAPGQKMESFNAFYFSFVTLSTVGYGDITPISRGARMLAVMESVTGMLYVAVLVARLVLIYSAAPAKSVDN